MAYSLDEGHGPAAEVQTLRKVYNLWTGSAYQVLMMASWTCNVVLYSTVFDIGGPMMLIYSTIIVTLGQCLMMCSLAEMCTVWPYAGGQQSYTKYLAPQSIRRFLSYFVGWIVMFGEIATAAGCAMNSAQIIAGIVQLNHADFVSHSWIIWLLYAALTLLSILFCFSQKHLPAVAVLGCVITLGGGIAWAASFLALVPKHSARFVFTHFINNSGYKSSGWVGIMSFYTPIYALYGTDGILHIAEEMRDAERSAPRAMVWSMIFSGATSLMGALVMGFCAGDWEVYLETDTAWVTWFVNALDSTAGGSALAVLVIVLLNFLITVSINTASSRLAWGMAKDHALPFSNVFMKINPTAQTPLNAVFLIVGAELIIGLVVFGSDLAFEIIVSLGGVAIQFGYLVPVLMIILRGRDMLPAARAFTLGRFGRVINITAACWSSLIIVILFFPLYVPITSDNLLDMNWAIAIFSGLCIIIAVDWVVRGRFHYVIVDEEGHSAVARNEETYLSNISKGT